MHRTHNSAKVGSIPSRSTYIMKTFMRPETRKSLEMLFEAKWNLPKAAKNANLTYKEMKIIFNEYCVFHPPTYETE